MWNNPSALQSYEFQHSGTGFCKVIRLKGKVAPVTKHYAMVAYR